MLNQQLETNTMFEGWMAFDKNAIHNGLKLASFQPKTWEQTDIDVKITHCGLCGSDLHSLRSGWVSPYAELHLASRILILDH
jgi:alcohol dehydrogenase (NADP+)